MFIVKITSLAVLTGDKTHRKQTHNGLRVGGDQLNVQLTHFKCRNDASGVFFFSLSHWCNGTVCQFEPFHATLNPVFKATQRATEVGAG